MTKNIFLTIKEILPKKLLLTTLLLSRMKISVITDISVTCFYEYIGYIEEISADILEKKNLVGQKLIKTHENVRKIS